MDISSLTPFLKPLVDPWYESLKDQYARTDRLWAHEVNFRLGGLPWNG